MLPPFNWRLSRQRRYWLLLASIVALLSVWVSGLGLVIQCLLTLVTMCLCIWQWREKGPARLAWRDGYLWLDDRAHQIAGVSASLWPCWVLALVSATDDTRSQLLLWPDSLDKEELRQLRVAIATHSL